MESQGYFDLKEKRGSYMSVQKSIEQMNMIPAEAKQTFLLAGHSEVDPDYDTHNVFRNDVDDSKTQVYSLSNKKILVHNSYYVGAVYIESDVKLESYFK